MRCETAGKVEVQMQMWKWVVVYVAVLGVLMHGMSLAAANGRTVIQEASGNGTRSLQPFSVDGQWELQWDLKGQSIEVYLRQSSGELVSVTPMAAQKKPGKGSTFYPQGGYFYLRVIADGDWTLSVVQLGRPGHVPQSSALTPSPSNPPASPNLLLHDVVWSRSRAGVLFANFTVENTGDVALRDFTVTCIGYGPSGTAIDTASTTRYDILEAKTTREYEGIEIGPIHSQVASLRCSASPASK